MSREQLNKIKKHNQNYMVLASSSPIRNSLLKGAGVKFTTIPANIDESSIKNDLINTGATGLDAAVELATLKAKKISISNPQAMVVGADQLLECNGLWFDKAKDRSDAASQLRQLSGKTHILATATVILMDGKILWTYADNPILKMRNITDDFIEFYLSVAEHEAVGCVGAYRLEGLGAQLFEKIDGDYFTILGLPLIPLLEFLRSKHVIKT